MRIRNLFLITSFVLIIFQVSYYKLNSESKANNLTDQSSDNIDFVMINREIDSFLFSKLDKMKTQEDNINTDQTSQRLFSEELMEKIKKASNKDEVKKIIAEDDIKNLSYSVDYYKKLLKKKNEKSFIDNFNKRAKKFLIYNKRKELIPKTQELFNDFIINLDNEKSFAEKKIEKIKETLK
jgi:hypothetical protein